MRRIFGGEDQAPAELQGFIDVVNEAYHEFDADRAMIERSLDLSSQELLQANSDLGAVLEAFLDLFFHIDADGVILAYRVGTAADLYVTPDQLIGKRIQNIPLDHVGTRFRDAIRRVHATESLVSLEYSLQLNEEEQCYEAHLLPLRNREIAVIIRNVTEQKQAEQRERKLQNRLARSERMESLGVLAGGVAHDLNNILGPLVAYPGMILRTMPEDNEVREMLVEIEKSAGRAVAVIQDLLTMARRGNYVLEPVDVNALVRNYIDSIAFKQLQAQHPQCVLDLELQENIPRALATQHHLSQAIMNLIINAYEAIPEDGRVTVTTEYRHVPEHAGIYETIHGNMYVVIRIRDTGTGIPEDSVEHIFEPFFTKKKMGRSGSGLGLTVVYGVVRDMNGHIEVDTKAAEGTEMRLYIPATQERALTDEEPGTDFSGHERVLIVDDVPEQRRLAKSMLIDLGYSVETSPSGHDAVGLLRDQTFDLILMDMIMEDGFDGLDAYKEILKTHPNQKCLIVSGFSETDRVHEALRCGAGGFVAKPYRLDQLGKAIRDELDRH